MPLNEEDLKKIGDLLAYELNGKLDAKLDEKLTPINLKLDQISENQEADTHAIGMISKQLGMK